MSSSRNCRASEQFNRELNARWPHRSKASDGTLGDQSHRARVSDHNPNRQGVVRARDIDVDGILAVALAERIVRLGKSGFKPLRGGYVILNRRIAGTHTNWQWHAYNGTDPHTGHIHLSFADAASDYDNTDSWGIATIGRKVGDRVLRPGIEPGTKTPAQDIKNVQNALNLLGNNLKLDGLYGPTTQTIVRRFKVNRGRPNTAVFEAKDWALLRSAIR